ncbi:MAG: hypothetical protein K6E10_10830 [Eubacterium sp.]|nr:hypothetical protein [Eubacterium sp.]
MNKKLLLGLIIALIVALGAFIVIFNVIKNKKNRVFIDSDYPITYEYKKDNTVVLTLDGSKTKNLKWAYEISDDTKVAVTQKGKEKGGKVKYVITPVESGLCDIRFYRKNTIAEYEYNVVSMNLPIYVTEVGTKLKVNFLEDPIMEIGPEVYGEETNIPFLLYVNEYNEGEINYLKADNDWVFDDPNKVVTLESLWGEEGYEYYIIRDLRDENGSLATGTDASSVDFEQYGFDADSAEVLNQAYGGSLGDGMNHETTITFTSQSAGVTEYVDVFIDTTGKMTLKKGEAPKK